MNKMLWIMTQNKDDCLLLQNKVIIELLKKQEIIGYGLSEVSNYDYFFHTDSSFWMLVDENFDYISSLRNISSRGNVGLVARINDVYYCFDSNGHQCDNGMWNENDANDFVTNGWNFEALNNGINDNDYHAKIDELFNENVKEEKLYFENWEMDNNSYIRTCEIENDINDVDLNAETQEVLNNKLSDFDNFQENILDENINEESQFILNDLDNEIMIQEEKKYCGSENCRCKAKDEALKAEQDSNSLCDRCFQKNCVCTDEEDDIFDFDLTNNPNAEGFECSPDKCGSCTGCDWDFSDDDDMFYDENMSHHFSCACEDKGEDCSCAQKEENDDFINDFVVFAEPELGVQQEQEVDSDIDNDAIVKYDEFRIDLDDTNILTPNDNIFDDQEIAKTVKHDSKPVSSIDISNNNVFFNPISKNNEESSNAFNYEIDWSTINTSSSNLDDKQTSIEAKEVAKEFVFEPIQPKNIEEFNLDFDNFDNGNCETLNSSDLSEFKADSLNDLIQDLNKYVNQSDDQNFEIVVDEFDNKINSFELEDTDNLTVDIINSDELNSLVEKYNSKFNEIKEKEHIDDEKILDDILEVVDNNTKHLENEDINFDDFNSTDFVKEYSFDNQESKLITIEANPLLIDTKDVKPILSKDIVDNKIVFDYEKEQLEPIATPIVSIDFTEQSDFDDIEINFVENKANQKEVEETYIEYVKDEQDVSGFENIEVQKPEDKQIDSNLYVDFNEYISSDNSQEINQTQYVSNDNDYIFINVSNNNNEANIAEDIKISNNFDAPVVEEYEYQAPETPEDSHVEAAQEMFFDTTRRSTAFDRSISQDLKKFLIELNKEKERLKKKREEIQKRNRKARMLFSRSTSNGLN